MKRFFLSLILSLFVFAAYAEGISNYKELLAFAKAVNKEADISAWQNEKGVVCLDADIDMKKGKKFPTIKVFKGKFDGCGHKLYNWNTKTSLFGTLEPTAVLENLVVDASCKLTVKTSYNEENEYISFLVKVNRGKIQNCVNHGTIEHVGEEAFKAIYVGSIAALNYNIVYKCKNTGNVTSRINFTKHAKGMSLRMGGLIGTCYGKSLAGVTIARCENTGNVSYMGDYPNSNIGGVVGESSKATVKYCVNRGNVVAVGLPIANTKVKGYSRAGGITSWANCDILCCDNFGVIATSGAHESHAAGICCRPNGALDMVNCVNYGKISTNSSGLAYTGGIAAYTNQNVHLVNCFNYGQIVSEGTERQGWAGGIAGAFTSRKGLKTGAYIRDCVNYAKVTNKSNHKNSTTAGVLGYGSGRADKGKPEVKLNIVDCANYGNIDAKTGKKDNLCAHRSRVIVRGERYDDFAKVMKPWADGTNVFGRVVDSNEMPVAGVVVSDGKQSVKTDVNGEFAMKSDMGKVHFVSISIPAEYEIPLRDSRPQFFRRVPRYAQAVRADFVLKKREKVSDEFVLAMIGDPQTRGLYVDNSTERFRDLILPDVAEYKAGTDKEVYAINLGDLLYNFMDAYDDYVDVVATAKVPMFSAIGNHDYDQRTILETELGTPYFENYLAPLNYSFNIGKMHFVIVNNILYNRPSDKHRYKVGMEGYTYEWLKNDLAHVPTDNTIVICGHSPIFKWRGKTKYEKSANYKKYSTLLSKYNKVYAWAGHTHQNHSYDYADAPARQAHMKNIEVITVARCQGQIRLNRELNTDGTPNGYMVAEVKGDKMEWYYKAIGHDRSYQIRAYSPTRTNTEYVKANIWNHSPETWSMPEWWENGVKVADMEYSKEKDPDYLEIYAEHNQQKMGKTERSYSKPANPPFFFRVKPSAGVREGEIRVTDQFGVTYTQKVQW